MKNLIAMLVGFCVLGLLSASPALGQAATDVKCDGCVQSGDIATNGVRRIDIQNFSINTPKLNNFAVTTEKIKSSAVTTSKLANGAVTVIKVAPELSNALGMFCLPDNVVVGMDTTGNFSCEVPRTLASDESDNTHAGTAALDVNTSGTKNTAYGSQTLSNNTDGFQNTAIGYQSLNQNTGNANTAVGSSALSQNTANTNTAVGNWALKNNITGSQNTAVGSAALDDNTSGFGNTAVGIGALGQSNGSWNIAIGLSSGGNLTTGNNNIAIGNSGSPAEERTIRIGHGGTHNRAFIAAIRGTATDFADAVSVLIDSAGQLGTVSSSARYKENIQDMGSSSDRLLQLRPVTFHYKEAYADGEKPLDYGLIAEEVAAVFPELVVYNEESQPETVKYRLLSSMLLNELQKQQSQLVYLNTQVAEMSELKAQVAELNQLVQQMAKLALPATELVANNTGD